MYHEVPPSADIDRVLALARRTWKAPDGGWLPVAIQLAEYLTNQLRNSQPCDRCGQQRQHLDVCPYPVDARPPLALRPVQAVWLWELAQYLGAYGQVPVGGGKSLALFLAAWMVPPQGYQLFSASTPRPFVFLPANLIRDNWKLWEIYAKYWLVPRPLHRVESYQQFTQKNSFDMLERAEPTFLGLDECDKARDVTRSTAKRIGYFLDQRPPSQLARGFLSGTNKRKSLADDAHFMLWALCERAPVPLSNPAGDKALQDWCLALDEETKVQGGRIRPGALMRFAEQAGLYPENPSEPSIGELRRAREGFRLRVEQTPGIIIHDQNECDQPLYINFWMAPEDPLIESFFENFQNTGCRPDDVLIPNPLEKKAHAEQGGCGFWLTWDPPPPQPWRDARKAWHQQVRDEIESSNNLYKRALREGRFPLPKRYDTELMVAEAYPDSELLAAWRYERDKPFTPDGKPFEPNSVPRWVSSSVLQACWQWAEALRQHGDTGIIWVKHVAFAMALSTATGLPYYGAGGERIDQYGRPDPSDTIKLATEKARAAGRLAPIAILSIDANFRGRNLQAYANNLIVGWEQAGTRIEQLLGRTHRSGQSRPVTVTVLVTCYETYASFRKTESEARFVQTQGLTQKILKAEIDRSGLRDHLTGKYRWVKRTKNNEDDIDEDEY